MVGSAECAMYLYMILNHLTELRHAAHLNLPFVVTEGEVHFGEMFESSAGKQRPRESSAGLSALLEGPSKFGATPYVSPRSMDPYGSDHQCI